MTTQNNFLTVAGGGRYVAPQPAGAGRVIDLQWPHLVGDPTNQLVMARGGGAAEFTAATTQSGTPSQTIQLNGDTTTVGLNSVLAGDLQIVDFGAAFPIQPRLLTSKITSDDRLFYRVLIDMAMTGTAIVNDNAHDFGIQIARNTGATGLINKDVNQGVGFQIIDTTHVSALLRGAGGFLTQPLPVITDTTKLNTYEIRWSMAGNGTASVLQLYINGVPQVNIVAPFMPTNLLTGANAGFRVQVVNFGGGLNILQVARVKMIAAPTLADTF